MGESEREQRDSRRRAVSPIVGLAVLLGFVILGSLAVFVVAGGVISDLSTEADVEQATDSMDAIAHELSSRGYASAELPDTGTTHLDEDAGAMRIDVGNETVVTESEGQLGTLYYETGETTVAFQGGGVWRKQAGERSTMESPPPFEYTSGDDPMLSVPIVALNPSQGRVARDRLSTVDTTTRFPSDDVSNPLTENLTISVRSEFYRGWGDYFEQRFDGDVAYDHGADRVSVTLEGGNMTTSREIEREERTYDGLQGILVNDGSGAHARNSLTVDSYDSSQGPYDAGPNDRAHLRSNGDLRVSNDVTVSGNVEATGYVDFSNSFEVKGYTIVGDQGTEDYTNVYVDGGGTGYFHDLFSTKVDLQVENGAQFDDDVIVGGDVTRFEGHVAGTMYVHGQMNDEDDYAGTIEGDLVVGDDVEIDEDDLDVQGQIVEDASEDQLLDPVDPVTAVPDVDVDIDVERNDFEMANDNFGEDDIQNSGSIFFPEWELQNCAPQCELDEGRYYIEDAAGNNGEIAIGNNEELVLDATDGEVEIFLDEDLRVHDGGEVRVEYDEDDQHPVTIYSAGDFKIEQDSHVTVPNHRSPMLSVYLDHDHTWRADEGSTFVGAVYGLEEGGDRADVMLSGGSGTSVYGAFVGDIGTFDQIGEFHYDGALADGEVGDPRGGGGVTEQYETEDAEVVYLHVDRRSVEAG